MATGPRRTLPWPPGAVPQNGETRVSRRVVDKLAEILEALVQRRGWRTMMKRGNGSSRSKICSRDGTSTDRSADASLQELSKPTRLTAILYTYKRALYVGLAGALRRRLSQQRAPC